MCDRTDWTDRACTGFSRFFTTSGQETERVYSYNPGARTGRQQAEPVEVESPPGSRGTWSGVNLPETGSLLVLLHPQELEN